jgi:hypothetical protein
MALFIINYEKFEKWFTGFSRSRAGDPPRLFLISISDFVPARNQKGIRDVHMNVR